MELRAYGKILRRRWLYVLIPAVIVLIAGLATYRPPPDSYHVGVNFIVAQTPGPAAGSEDQERYYNWLTSEYIVNGLTDWVNGGRFAETVSARLAADGRDIPRGAVQAGLVADNARSVLSLSLNAGDPDALAAMMAAAIAVLTSDNAIALPQLGGRPAVLVQLDEPVVNQIPGSLRGQLDLPLRLAVALAAGLGLAILVDYVDPTVRERDDLLALGLPLLGEIPRPRR